jgi:hypothetical protein
MKLKIIVTLLSMMVSFFASANGSYVGKLQPFYYSNSLYLVPVESQILNKPVCATRHYLRLPNADDSPTFNAKFSIILAAWMSKQELEVTGTGQCTSEGDEIIRSIKPK